MTEPVVKIRGVSKAYTRDGFEVIALDNVDLDIADGSKWDPTPCSVR